MTITNIETNTTNYPLLSIFSHLLQVQSARDIDLATLTVVSQITDWAAHNQCLDDHEGVQEIKYKLDLLKDDMNLVQNEERKMEMLKQLGMM